MVREFKDHLRGRLQDPEFAKSFGAAAAKADFALTLTEARIHRKLTQNDLSTKLGTRQSYIAKLEGGEANPTIGTIGTILAILGFRLSTKAVPLESKEYLIYSPNRAIDSITLSVPTYQAKSISVTAEIRASAHNPAPMEVSLS
jgi:transcriptional regulator with XRE-family HTH domain